MRMLVTLSDPIGSSFAVVPGQAGNPVSPHYQDQLGPWRNGLTVKTSPSSDEMKDWPLLVLAALTGN